MLTFVIGCLYSVAFFGFSFFLLDNIAGLSAFERNQFRNRLREIRPQSPITVEKINRYSEIKALDEILHKQEFSRKLNRLIEIAGWRLSISIFILVSLFATALIYFFLRWHHVNQLVAFASGGAVMVVVPALTLKFKYDQYIKKFSTHFPKALQTIQGGLSAGLSFAMAFERVAKDCPYPVNVEFTHLLDELSLGKSFMDAVIGLQRRVPTLDVRTFVIAVNVQQEAGGNLVELMANLGDTITARTLLRQEFHALTAQARLSGWIIGLLPLFLAGIIKVINPAYYSILVNTESGKHLLMITLALEVIGIICIKKIVTFKVMA